MSRKRPTIDLNEADAEELEQIEGISAERARLIVDYREENGPFHSWDDLARVGGIAAPLVAEIRAHATLGDLAGDSGDHTAGEPDELLEPDLQVETLTALAQLDLEASAAYELCAEYIADRELRAQLLGFRSDHQRHVRDLNQLIGELHGHPLPLDADVRESVLLKLVGAVSALGLKPAILSMLATEQLTNATYENALELPIDADTIAVLERNFADEQRHLRALDALSTRAWLNEEEEEEEPFPPDLP
jgi:competence ComEA-like helix-hairpin-helix protein